MLTVFVALAILFSIFAIQNTASVPITLGTYKINQVPLYVVLGIALLLGLCISTILSLSDSLRASLKIRGKDNSIKDAKSSVHELTKKVNELEIENAQLRDQLREEQKDPKAL